ncbi:MAG: hypothetical protein LUG16_03470, partial [Candidatus Gastranaerophilales bacterium]|nr:hypothetical protein [Candidatus Gastranaerophilales bacterium]
PPPPPPPPHPPPPPPPQYYILMDGNINDRNTFQTDIINTIYETATVIDYKDYNSIINKKEDNKDIPNIKHKNLESGLAIASYVIFQK